MRPNLAKLLADTACDVFTAVLPVWKEKPLFHLHYTELLRLAALYKYVPKHVVVGAVYALFSVGC